MATTAAVATGGTTASSAAVTGCVDAAACTAAGQSCLNAAGETCNCAGITMTWSCLGVVAGTGGAAPLSSTVTPCTEWTEGIRKNGAYDQIAQGSYFVFNNVWGSDPKYTDGQTTPQAVWTTCNNGSAIGWGASFDWAYNASTVSSVKSYQSAVLGWHWGWPVPIESTGMPLHVGSSGPAINCTWDYTITTTADTTMNVAYDLWIHSVALTGLSDSLEWCTWDGPNSDGDTCCTSGSCAHHLPTDEVMIWLYNDGAGPISASGQAVATNLSFGGTLFNLWVGQIANAWNVYSFVPQGTGSTTGMDLNLQEFLTYLVSNNYLSSSKYLSSIEAGSEVFYGIGELNTSSYGCYLD